ncbi:MAG: hypothetical protein JWO98_1246 [Frankiales bacterium]|nr:hypothetical protein [Frankiales bacterium]
MCRITGALRPALFTDVRGATCLAFRLPRSGSTVHGMGRWDRWSRLRGRDGPLAPGHRGVGQACGPEPGKAESADAQRDRGPDVVADPDVDRRPRPAGRRPAPQVARSGSRAPQVARHAPRLHVGEVHGPGTQIRLRSSSLLTVGAFGGWARRCPEGRPQAQQAGGRCAPVPLAAHPPLCDRQRLRGRHRVVSCS